MSKLKERTLIKRRSELGWTEADEKKTSLPNLLAELKVENGERMLRFEPDQRHVQLALHDLRLDKKSANDVEPRRE